MIFWKILISVLSSFIALLGIGLEYKWHDKKTKWHKRIRNILITLIILSAAGAIYVIYKDELRVQKDIQQAQEDRSALQKQLVDLNSKLDPFIELARSRYPKETTDLALQKLMNDMSELKSKTRFIEEKVVATEKRTNKPWLELVSINTKKMENDYEAIIKFKPTNDIPIGKINFVAKIIGDSFSKIANFSPLGSNMDIQIRNSVDNKEYSITFTPMSNEEQTLQLKVTERTKIALSGSKIDSFTFEIK